MACFVVPVTEAVITAVVTKAVKSKESKKSAVAENTENRLATENKIPFSVKLRWLSNMLWGGSVLLAFEHLWHGEVEPWFPFLTAASSVEETLVMLHEMATVGVAMSAVVTAVWGVMLLVVSAMEKKQSKLQAIKEN